jgi:predicted small integral membrane protein
MKNYKFLEWGYKTAIFLSLFALIASSAFLFYYLSKSNPEQISAATMAAYSAERLMVLLSTAIFVAMAFGFLGFALFLIQAHGEVSGSLEHGNTKVNIARMSPGIFVILCATVIILFAISSNMGYKQKNVINSEPAPSVINDSISGENTEAEPEDEFVMPHN